MLSIRAYQHVTPICAGCGQAMSYSGGYKTGDMRWFCATKTCDQHGIQYDAPTVELYRSANQRKKP